MFSEASRRQKATLKGSLFFTLSASDFVRYAQNFQTVRSEFFDKRSPEWL